MTELTPNGLEDVFTTSELAAHLKVSRQVIYDLRHNGQGPRGFHVGKELRYTVSEINAWLEQRSDPVSEGAVDAR
ncbi:transcriptional regulator, AlpA family [Microbacterium sp. cf046]|uniref:helix-turn-helix transcriptional regulator n=1 Tax=Microbacterium sp. cf046 TaxID=1761803 RepID=UPI0008EB7B57|nr:helix-turn-helix domain-containing protein [Microbacterium sp. cf046]SFS16457.1 transcriptional regulator, AlpA family [Microbacterium sp. cf046]